MVRMWFDRLLLVTAALSAVLIAFMALSISAQVILRYFFRYTVLWVNDFVEYSLLWSTFLGSAYVLKESKHIEMDFFVSKFSQKPKLYMDVVTSCGGFAVMAVISWYSLLTVLDHYHRGINVIKTVAFPKYIALLPIFVGALLLTIQFALRAADNWKRARAQDTTREQVIYDL